MHMSDDRAFTSRLHAVTEAASAGHLPQLAGDKLVQLQRVAAQAGISVDPLTGRALRSTGIKFHGDGEWQARKHGPQGRRADRCRHG